MKKILILLLMYPWLCQGSNEFHKEILPYDLGKYDNYDISETPNEGASYDPQTGGVNFAVTDISLPGNFDLPVELRRWIPNDDMNTGGPNDWFWDIPFIRGYYVDKSKNTMSTNYNIWGGWHDGKNCTDDYGGAYYTVSSQSVEIEPYSYWDGKLIHIPGGATEKFLDGKSITTPGISKKIITKSGLYISSCTDAGNGEQGIVVKSKDGKTYYFNQIKKYETGTWTGVGFNPIAKFTKLLMASKVEDRFGNSVVYSYDTNGRLEKISSSDGRIITIVYNGDKVIATAAGKTWNYELDKTSNIFTVTLPDNTTWKYPRYLKQYSPTSNFALGNTDVVTGKPKSGACDVNTRSYNNIKSQYIIKTPRDAYYTYDFELTYHGRTNVDADQITRTIIEGSYTVTHISYARNLDCVVYKSLRKKTLKFNDTDSYHWDYEYSQNTGSYNSKYASASGRTTGVKSITPPKWGSPTTLKNLYDYKTTTVTIAGETTKYYVDRLSTSFSEGQIVAIEKIFDSSLKKKMEYKYAQGTRYGETWYGSQGAYVPTHTLNLQKIEYLVNLTNRHDTYYESDGDNKLLTEYSGYDQFGNHKVIKKTQDGNSLHLRYSYLNDIDNWIVGLPMRQDKSFDGLTWYPSSETTYHDYSVFKRLPKALKNHGLTVAEYNDYHLDGSLKKIIFNGSNRYEQFENYFRGKPRKITLPCATTNGCSTVNGSTSNSLIALLEVNADGSTQSVTDFNGNKTSYQYNPIGWLTKIDYADPKWADKIISYATVAAGDDGIDGSGVAVGSLRQTVSQGNYEKRVYHDGLLRPVFTRERDTANASTIRYQAMKYDQENRPTLFSFPSSSASNRTGMETEYDALGRVTTQTRTSDGSVSSREYLAGNKVAVTDGENNITTTTYLSYGVPAYDKPILIEASDGDDIEVEYNVFDQVTSITQGNITEARFYDSYQQLCKSIRPETGITAYGYNSQGQPVWHAQGTSGSTTSCDAAAIPASHKVLLSYDNLGQLQAENFPDTTPDNSYRYDANGNLTSLISGPVSWSYLYNSLDGLEKETLSLDGKSFVLDWEYSGLGAVRSLKYPSGVLVDFAPNGLGQPTKAGSFATNVSYHPNGQIKQFTYGNGIVRNVALDSTGRIDLMTDSKGGVLKNSLDPSYDYNDNLAGLIDGVDAANNISNLSYDGLDRLKSADGRWGQGSYSYDGLGNITSRSISGAAINYSYDNLNRLSKLSGAYGYSYQYDSRGNVTHNGRYGLTFNRANQVSEAKGIPYAYDGHNRRVKQTKPEGSHYSVYSSAGQLLHRKVEHGSHTDSVYLGKQLIAEVENGDSSLVTSDPSVAKPSINFNITQYTVGSSCPPKMVCATNGITYHDIRWTTENATSCTGNVVRNPDTFPLGSISISGTASKLSYPANGTVYTINLTCVGAGGQSSAQRILSGVGLPNEM